MRKFNPFNEPRLQAMQTPREDIYIPRREYHEFDGECVKHREVLERNRFETVDGERNTLFLHLIDREVKR